MNLVVQMFVNINCQSQKIKKEEIKGNFENVFALSTCSILMGLVNNSWPCKKIAPLIRNNNNVLHNIIPKETNNATRDEGSTLHGPTQRKTPCDMPSF